MKIDLHGLLEHEAISKLEMKLLDCRENQSDYLEVVFGNGDVLKRAVLDFVEAEGFRYTYENDSNQGAIILKF